MYAHTQAILLPIYFTTCLIHPPLCHAGARFVGTLAIQLYTDALIAAEKGKDDMPQSLSIRAPPIARWFYGLPVSLCCCIHTCTHYHQVPSSS